MSERKTKIRKIVLVAIFAAFSFVLYLFPKFPLPIFPSFLDIQFSNLPVIIGALVLGPVHGSLIVIIRAFLKLPFTSTAGIGELADLLIGLAVVLSSSLYYKYNKTKNGGAIALILSTVSWVVMGVVTNKYIVMPFYIKAFGFDAVFSMLELIDGITKDNFMNYYILYAVIPFNLILSVMVNIITYLVYKKVSDLIRVGVDG